MMFFLSSTRGVRHDGHELALRLHFSRHASQNVWPHAVDKGSSAGAMQMGQSSVIVVWTRARFIVHLRTAFLREDDT